MPQVVLVVGVGRSGSTLLQRVLNTMPSTNVCGENRNAWLHVARFASAWLQLRVGSRAEYDRREQQRDHFWLAWYNVEGGDTLIDALRTLFLALYQGDRWRRVGFKEIRLGQQGYELLQAQLEFFRMLFPDCRIIFNVRSAQAIARSQARQARPADFGDPAAQALFERYAREHRDVLLWRYEDWDKPRAVQRLYAYLGEPYSEAYRRALDIKTQS